MKMSGNFKRPETDDELWHFILDTWGIAFPRKSPVPGHNAVFDFVADMFFERAPNAILLANRNGGKTFAVALVAVLDSIFKPGCETASVAAIMSQTKKGYRHFLDFLKAPKVWPHVHNSIQSDTTFLNGSRVEILTGTISGVNSPHPEKANADEVELMKWDVIQEFLSMAKSDPKKGIPARNIFTSTRKYIYGSMQRMLNMVESGEMPGVKIYTWNIIGVLEEYSLEELEEYRDLVKTEADGSKISFYELLAPYAGKSDGFYPLADAAQKFSSMTLDTWKTQWTNEKPSREGLIYFMFDSEKHTQHTLWHKWRQHFVGQDFGTSNPNVALLIEYDPTTDVYYVLAEDYSYRTAITTAMDDTYIRWAEEYMVEDWICDPRGAGSILEMNKKFIEAGRDDMAIAAPSTKIEDGIELIRGLLLEGRLIIDEKRCPKLKLEMEQLYHYKEGTDAPAKEDDHGCDALRYALEWHMQQGGGADVRWVQSDSTPYEKYGYGI